MRSFLNLLLTAISSVSALHWFSGDDHQYITTSGAKHETTLRICNAYPHSSEGVAVSDATIMYGSCVEKKENLKVGQRLDFFLPDHHVLLGSFEVEQIAPSVNEDTLLIVIQPRSGNSRRASFQSHAFSGQVTDPQVALLDAYSFFDETARDERGVDQTPLLAIAEQSMRKSEDLKFDSVVALHPGSYVVDISRENQRDKFTKNSKRIHVTGATDKVSVIRIGTEGQYPEELIVFSSAVRSFSFLVVCLYAFLF